jgi:membrane associated rhomboid family serine protease
MKRLDVLALAAAMATILAATFFLVGVGQQVWPGWGRGLLDLAASVYPGYHGPAGFGSVLVVTMYAAVDGAVAGAVLAWLYNVFTRDRKGSAG